MQGLPEHFEGAPVAALVIDIDTMRVSWHNDLARRFLEGSDRSDLVGTTIDEFIPMAEAVGMNAAVRKVAETGCCEHKTLHVVGDHRRRRTMRASAYRLPSARVLLLATLS
jgi:hypothetical protein